jgi:hypothetical protein
MDDGWWTMVMAKKANVNVNVYVNVFANVMMNVDWDINVIFQCACECGIPYSLSISGLYIEGPLQYQWTVPSLCRLYSYWANYTKFNKPESHLGTISPGNRLFFSSYR